MSVLDTDIPGQDASALGRRDRWSSRLAFILAAAGSAVGLGSIWKFPYITGVNGGGWFVFVYLVCIVLVAMPIMVAEILIGRTTRSAPVGAVRTLVGRHSRWRNAGWPGVAAGFLILSYYFVVAGWTLHYSWLALTGALSQRGAGEFATLFASVYADPTVNVFWQTVFVALTAGIVMCGVQRGIERCSRVLFPVLLLLMLALLVQAIQSEGFARAVDFVFGLRGRTIGATGVLEALGHSFFTLSLGMGAMITYGSYAGHRDDVVTVSAAVAGLDTFISLLACLTLFPILFTFGLDADVGPGLVFVSVPAAFAQMPAGAIWASLFFVLLAIAALASTISVFEVFVSHLVDERGMTRRRAALLAAIAVLAAGIPAALSGSTQLFGDGVRALTGRNWFDSVDFLVSNWLLPLSGLAIALCYAWRVGAHARQHAFVSATRFGKLYWSWIGLLRYFVPPAVGAVFLHAIGVI